MAFVGKAVKGFLKLGTGLLGAGVSALVGGKKGKKGPAPLPAVSRDDAAAQVAADDELRRRKGAAADILNGATGAEAALSGGRLILGN